MSEVRCEQCGTAPATLRITRILRGTPLESRLCVPCAGTPLPLGNGETHCPRCGSEVDVKALFTENPLPVPLEERSFLEWESRLKCRICGELLFPTLPASVLDFLKNDPLLGILRRRRPPPEPGPA